MCQHIRMKYKKSKSQNPGRQSRERWERDKFRVLGGSEFQSHVRNLNPYRNY